MKRKHFSEEQITKAIKSHEAGVKVADICRELGVSEPTFYRWRAKHGGMGVSEGKSLRALESENRKLEKKAAELMADRDILKQALAKKW